MSVIRACVRPLQFPVCSHDPRVWQPFQKEKKKTARVGDGGQQWQATSRGARYTYLRARSENALTMRGERRGRCAPGLGFAARLFIVRRNCIGAWRWHVTNAASGPSSNAPQEDNDLQPQGDLLRGRSCATRDSFSSTLFSHAPCLLSVRHNQPTVIRGLYLLARIVGSLHNFHR